MSPSAKIESASGEGGEARRARAQLDPFPALAHAWDVLVPRLLQPPGAELAVKGSVADGRVDAFSDLDFELRVPGGSFAEERDRVIACVGAVGLVLSWFPATHLGFDRLLIFFVETSHGVVKVDIEVVLDEAAQTQAVGAGSGDPDFADMFRKFTGWVWYTYTKLARGESLEAVDSMQLMRREAVLPVMQWLGDVPREGYRRVEERLSEEDLAALHDSHPATLDRGGILASLRALVRVCDQVHRDVAQRRGHDHRDADLDAMMGRVEAAERARSSDPG